MSDALPNSSRENLRDAESGDGIAVMRLAVMRLRPAAMRLAVTRQRRCGQRRCGSRSRGSGSCGQRRCGSRSSLDGTRLNTLERGIFASWLLVAPLSRVTRGACQRRCGSRSRGSGSCGQRRCGSRSSLDGTRLNTLERGIVASWLRSHHYRASVVAPDSGHAGSGERRPAARPAAMRIAVTR